MWRHQIGWKLVKMMMDQRPPSPLHPPGPLPRKPADISSVEENKQKTNYQQLRLINISVSGVLPRQNRSKETQIVPAVFLAQIWLIRKPSQEDSPAILGRLTTDQKWMAQIIKQWKYFRILGIIFFQVEN